MKDVPISQAIFRMSNGVMLLIATVVLFTLLSWYINK